MHELLGPAEAAHGFPTAHAILKHKPDIAKELWFPPDTQVMFITIIHTRKICAYTF
jgi:hypothetical protein